MSQECRPSAALTQQSGNGQESLPLEGGGAPKSLPLNRGRQGGGPTGRSASQGGYTLVPALAVMAILFMLAAAYLHGVFRFQATKTKHEETSMTAAAIAEAGLQKALAELTAAGGDIASTTYFNNSNHAALQIGIPDPVTGRVIGSFDAFYEDGSLIGSATVTGSTTAGQDAWGNQIWYDGTNQNYDTTNRIRRFGIKVDGYATHPDGSRRPGGQSVYVRALMNSPQSYAGLDMPANYVLYTNGNLTVYEGAGLYGGLTHTNGALSLRWRTPAPNSWQHVLPIYAYSPLSYAGSINYWYYHSHVNGGPHQHSAGSNSGTRPYGYDLPMGTDNEANYFHWHPITDPTMVTSILGNTSFFNFGIPSTSYHPKSVATKNFPTFDLSALLKVTKAEGGTTTDYDRGYWVGNADFRATYFGNDLRFTADSGSPPVLDPNRANASYADIAVIYVNDNSASPDFMKISATAKTGDYHAYTYRQIPPNGLILVKDGEVKIGNYTPISPATGGGYTVSYFGGNTIVDGRLTIVSYATNFPGTGPGSAPNAGDILLCGNVIYRNKVYVQPGVGARQYAPNESEPTGINSGTTTWISDLDGTPTTTTVNGEQVPVGKVCSLALYAANNVRIGLTPYIHAGETSAQTDKVRVMGQIIAGANPNYTAAQKATDNGTKNHPTNPAAQFRLKHDTTQDTEPTPSAYDTWRIYGSVSSFNSPLTSYFKARDYYHDETLAAMPMLGQPLINPAATYTNIPMILPGSWMQMAAH